MGREKETKDINKILIVDDVDTNRFVLRDIIQEMGYQPILTENGVQALKIIKRLRPSLIILDVAMPEMEKKNILYALIRVARENACYDEDHMERICYNCRKLAEAMQLSTDYGYLISDTYIDTIELAAPLCDLGNMSIPTDILRKTETLSLEDTAVIRTHTTIGAKILQDICDTGDYNDFFQMSIDIAHYHHENWDGSGYPCGKKGDEIPLFRYLFCPCGYDGW